MSWWDQTGDLQFENMVGSAKDLHAGLLADDQSLNTMILSGLSAAREKIPEAVTREPGFHASAVGDMCIRQEVFKRVLPRAKPAKKFPSSLLIRFEVGSAVHDRWQDQILGLMRVLKGTWSCTRCRHKVHGCLMPNTPCPACHWQVHPETHQRADARSMFISCGESACERSRSCSTCVEKRAAWPLYTTDCAEVCRWPTAQKFDDPARDCARCRRGGAWGFRETRISIPEFDLVGHFDGIVVYPCGTERLLEMKTKDSFAWDGMTEPTARHVTQSQIYMYGSGLREAVIAYINKNSGLMKEFLVKYDEDFVNRVKRNIEAVRTAVDAGELPNGVCGSPREKRAKECGYCDACFLGIDTVAELLARGIE